MWHVKVFVLVLFVQSSLCFRFKEEREKILKELKRQPIIQEKNLNQTTGESSSVVSSTTTDEITNTTSITTTTTTVAPASTTEESTALALTTLEPMLNSTIAPDPEISNSTHDKPEEPPLQSKNNVETVLQRDTRTEPKAKIKVFDKLNLNTYSRTSTYKHPYLSAPSYKTCSSCGKSGLTKSLNDIYGQREHHNEPQIGDILKSIGNHFDKVQIHLQQDDGDDSSDEYDSREPQPGYHVPEFSYSISYYDPGHAHLAPSYSEYVDPYYAPSYNEYKRQADEFYNNYQSYTPPPQRQYGDSESISYLPDIYYRQTRK